MVQRFAVDRAILGGRPVEAVRVRWVVPAAPPELAVPPAFRPDEPPPPDQPVGQPREGSDPTLPAILYARHPLVDERRLTPEPVEHVAHHPPILTASTRAASLASAASGCDCVGS